MTAAAAAAGESVCVCESTMLHLWGGNQKQRGGGGEKKLACPPRAKAVNVCKEKHRHMCAKRVHPYGSTIGNVHASKYGAKGKKQGKTTL